VRLLRIDMSSLSSQYEKLETEYLIMGGRGLIAGFANKEIPPTCEPLGKYNKLIIATGPLVGLGVSSTGRISVGGKSPLTGGIKEANGGGVAAQKLGKHGIRAIIIEGLPGDGELYYLYINRDCVAIKAADKEYKLLGNYALAKSLLSKYGKKSAVISIGPAGEMRMSSAGVFVNDTDGSQSRACARGGMGAVMGSKGLKAIVVDDDGEYRTAVSKPDRLKLARKAFHDAIRENPVVSGLYTKYGTPGIVESATQMGSMSTHNFRAGRFENAELISGKAFYELIERRKGSGRHTHSCMSGCIIKCSNVFPKEDGGILVSPLEYETIALLGANLGIRSLDDIGKLNCLCNDFGVDTIEIGATLGVAAEAGLATFGDSRSFIGLVSEIGEGSPLGRILGQGVETMAKVYGVSRIPAFKSQAMPAHDPRAIKGMAVTYATSPMGADHTAGLTFRASVDHKSPEGQMEASRNMQITAAIYDMLGFCLFVYPVVADKPELVMDIINAVFGTNYPPEWLTQCGKEVIKLERKFNLATGKNQIHDRPPEFTLEEPLPPYGQVIDIPKEDYKSFWDPGFWEEQE